MAKSKDTLLTVTLVKSTIGSKKDQIATVKALGLAKTNAERTHKDTPAIRGMIEKVKHLVKVQEA